MTREVIVHMPQSGLSEAVPMGYDPNYARVRNEGVAHHIAAIIGGRVGSPDSALPGDYYVPDRTLLADQARSLGVKTEDDLFGGVVGAALHRDKTIFHPLVTSHAIGHQAHSALFAESVGEAVLPGYTAFGPADARSAYAEMRAEGHEVRCKDPLQEGCNGQKVIETQKDLEQTLHCLPPERLAAAGLVLEANLADAETLSVGQLRLGGETYSYYGRQYTTTFNGTPTYGGTRLTMHRGDFGDLIDVLDGDNNTREAVRQARTVMHAYGYYDPVLMSRANFDVVQGTDAQGAFCSGVVDQSLRIGGASPAEVVAIQALCQDRTRTSVTSEVVVDWAPFASSGLSGGEVFFASELRRDVARVVAISAHQPSTATY